jgi:hypothetical protein
LEIFVREQMSETTSSANAGHAGRHRARRYLAGISAVGVAAGLVLTGAVSSSAAPAAASASPKVVTETTSTSSSTGQLTLVFKYEILGKRTVKPVSLTYSGGSSVRIKHPALVLSLGPGLAPAPGRHPVRERVPGGLKIVRIADVRHFSGKISLRAFFKVKRVVVRKGHRVLAPLGPALNATLASVSAKKPLRLQIVPGSMRVDLVLGPLLP